MRQNLSVIVAASLLGLGPQSPHALSKEVVQRMDSVVRAADRGWSFQGVVGGKIRGVARGEFGLLYRWSRGDDELTIRTRVFDTNWEAQSEVKQIVGTLSIGTKRLEGIGDLAYMAYMGGDRTSGQTNVYASVDTVLFHLSLRSSEEVGRRIAAGVARALAERDSPDSIGTGRL